MKETFKKFRFLLLGLILGVMGAVCAGCSSDDEWDEVPQPIQEWLAKYFPEQGVSQVSHTDGQWRVKLKNSCSLTFNDSLVWTQVNGCGGTLPAFFVSDALPPQFVEEYLQVTDNVDNVYSVTRQKDLYTVVLKNYTVVYNETTGETTQVQPGQTAMYSRPSTSGRTSAWPSKEAARA